MITPLSGPSSRRAFRAGLLLGALLLCGTVGASATGVVGPRPAAASHARLTFERLPLYFVENRGQLRDHAAYYVPGGPSTLLFSSRGLTYVVRGQAPRGQGASRVTQEFVRPRSGVVPAGTAMAAARFSYFGAARGARATGIPSYTELEYRQVWPGVDVRFRGQVRRLKYEYLVSRGADPGRIRLRVSGATALRVDHAGELVAETPAGAVTDERPYAYQEIAGRQVQVPCRYRLMAPQSDRSREYAFDLGPYERDRPLVIDPATVIYCGYLGGDGDDRALAVAADAEGNAYVTGETESTPATFPFAGGPIGTPSRGGIFVAKVSGDGARLLYCGYLGAGAGTAIAVDSVGSAYVAGYGGVPAVVGPSLTWSGGFDDAFVAKLTPDGTALEYSGYVGGSGDDRASGIAVDAAGSAYVVGTTLSAQDTFPVKVGPSLRYAGTDDDNSGDAWIAKVKPDGSGLDYCGYIGGSAADAAEGVAVDAGGNAYVAGWTRSDGTTFPVVGGPFPAPPPTYLGWGFLAKVAPDGSRLLYCGAVGSRGYGIARGIAVNSAGEAYVVGKTTVTPQPTPAPLPSNTPVVGTWGGGLAYLVKVRADGAGLVFAAAICEGEATAVATDAAGNAYVTGEYPDYSIPLIFAAEVSADGASLPYFVRVGGAAFCEATGIAVDPSGNAYLSGYVSDSQNDLPLATGPSAAYGGGPADGFVAEVGTVIPPAPPPPAPPDHLLLTAESSFEVAVSWTDRSADETGFYVERSDDGGTTWARVADLASTAPRATGDTQGCENGGLMPQRSYWYRVSAYNQTGTSAPTPAASVTTPVPGRLSVSPVTLQFGQVRVGKSASRSVVLSNTGASRLSVMTWPAARPFAVSTQESFTLAPGGSMAVPVTFAPRGTGKKRGFFTVTSDDPSRPSVQVELAGTGTPRRH